MTESLNSRSRVAKNTLFLYFRMLVTMAVGIYTSRVVLAMLGVSDYGIYNVVGGFVGMFAMISASMAASVQRFLSHEIGKKEKGNIIAIFTNAVLIHWGLAALILLIAETIGLWFLNNKLNIPSERYIAANVVYQFSLITFLIEVVSVPYNASLIAFEKMKAFAYVSIIQAILKLAIVYVLVLGDFDRLILYGVLNTLVACSIRIIYSIYVKRNIPECKNDRRIHKKEIRPMLSFAGWNMFGATSGIATDQGVNIVLNIFFGVVVNAARGISNQINAAVRSFVSNFQLAASPQIIKLYAAGEKDEMLNLVFNTSRYSFIMMMALGLPIVFNAEFILNLWLVTPPQHTVIFVQISLLTGLGYALSQPLSYAMHASGKVRNYQIVVGITSFMCLPVTYLVLKFGGVPESAYITALVFEFVVMMAKLVMLKPMIGIPIRQFLTNVVVKCYVLFIISSILPFCLYRSLESGLFCFFVEAFVTELCVLTTSFFLGLTASERKFVVGKVIRMIKKEKSN